MQEALLTYFTGEKNAALLLIGIGILGIAAALVFFQPRFSLRSFAVTLAIFAVIEIALGVGLFIRTDPQVRDLLAQLQSDASGFYSNEDARMIRVQRNFVVIQYIEAAVVVIAAVIALIQKYRIGISGVALAMLLHAAFLFAFDILAERRGAHYLDAIRAQSSLR